MTANLILQKYKEHTQRWLSEIDSFTPEAFIRSAPGEWNVAQVIDHISKTTAKCLDNAMLCSKAEAEKGRSGLGPAIFSLMGAFPPVRIKVKTPPKGVEDIYMPKPISQQQAKAALQNALQLMEAAINDIQNADKQYRIAHWAGGWFNAQQWYHSAEMHIKHHFRQLKRIKKAMGK